MSLSIKVLWALVIVNIIATSALGYMSYTGLLPVMEAETDQNASVAADVQIDDKIKNFITANPAHIIDAVNKYMAGAQDRGDEQTRIAIKANYDFLYAKGAHPVLGNPDGDVTVIEFLDYNCGYCKKAYSHLKDWVAQDPKIRIVLIEIPILHESSAMAGHWALAADQMGKYAPFHDKLMMHKGPINEEILTSFAKDIGLDPAKVKELADGEDIKKQITQNLIKSQELGVQGTPGFIIGDDIIRGYVELDTMKASADKLRKSTQ